MSQNRVISGSDKFSRKVLMLRLGFLISILTLLLLPNFAATAANAVTVGATQNVEWLSNQLLSKDFDEPGVIELEVVVPGSTQPPSIGPSPSVSPLPEESNALPGTGTGLAYLWILAVIGSVAAITGAIFWGKSRRKVRAEVR